MNPIAQLSDYVDERTHPRNYHLFLFFTFASIVVGALVCSATPLQVSLQGLRIPPLCPFKLLTGWDCPGCGITRALILAFHGQFRESFAVHMWGIPLAGAILLQLPYRLYLLLGGQPFRASAPLKLWSYRLVILSLIVPWALRMMTHFAMR